MRTEYMQSCDATKSYICLPSSIASSAVLLLLLLLLLRLLLLLLLAILVPFKFTCSLASLALFRRAALPVPRGLCRCRKTYH
jgi:hypothetical protein